VYEINHTFYVSITPSENRVVYDIMWKNMLQLEIQLTTIQYTRFAFWLIKATNTHSEHVLRSAFPQQQWTIEGVSLLLYTYNAPLVRFTVIKFSSFQ